MGQVKLSYELSQTFSTDLDNKFIFEYMPYAPESYVKVYIFGKMLAISGNEFDNSIVKISKLLGITEDEVTSAFTYWADKGLVREYFDPYAVEFLPVRSNNSSVRKFSKSKYTPFNEQIARMFPNRNFTPSEYNEYYTTIEDYHIELNAMLFVFSYCARLKGENVGWKYIVTVAKNLAKDGCRTAKEVEDALSGMSAYDDNIKQIFKALKIKRKAELSDKQLYKIWTNELGFELNAIIRLAKEVFSGEMRGLDSLINRYHSMGIKSLLSIDNYITKQNATLSLTKEILIKLDVRFSRASHYAETYVDNWLAKGFSGDALLVLADYCFRHDRRSCERLSEIVDKFEALGLVTENDIKQYFASKVSSDSKIKSLLLSAKSDRSVTSRDRNIYQQWQDWGINEELITYACSLAKGTENPLLYMNKLIITWQDNDIVTVDGAKKYSAPSATKQKVTATISADELNAKLRDINPEDI